MPLTYDDPISTYSDAAFTALELERIRDIVLADSVEMIEGVVDEITADQRKATRYDIDQWINRVGEGTVGVRGGGDGVDYSKVRDRNDIRRRVALRFGLDVPISSGLFRIPVVSESADRYDD